MIDDEKALFGVNKGGLGERVGGCWVCEGPSLSGPRL